jgi:hypothetical protein
MENIQINGKIFHSLERLILLKYPYFLHRAVYKFNANPIQIPVSFSTDREKNYSWCGITKDSN